MLCSKFLVEASPIVAEWSKQGDGFLWFFLLKQDLEARIVFQRVFGWYQVTEWTPDLGNLRFWAAFSLRAALFDEDNTPVEPNSPQIGVKVKTHLSQLPLYIY